MEVTFADQRETSVQQFGDKSEEGHLSKRIFGSLILPERAGKCLEYFDRPGQLEAMGDLYHKAARDSVLELLKTATKRDANRRDEDGMSPVHYAASCGNVEALRLLVGKG